MNRAELERRLEYVVLHRSLSKLDRDVAFTSIAAEFLRDLDTNLHTAMETWNQAMVNIAYRNLIM